MKMSNGITCLYVRSNEAYDIYRISSANFVEYHYELRNNGVTEDEILSQYVD